MNLLITNARVVDPSQDFDAKADVLIENGVIAEVSKKIRATVDTIDAPGLVVVPGATIVAIPAVSTGALHE